MGRFVISLSLVSLLLLLAGSLLAPASPFMWLASTATLYNVIRGGLSLILIVLLATVPPRPAAVRLMVSFIAVGTLVWTLIATNESHMLLLDTLAFVAASVSMGMVALEAGHDSSQVDIELLRLKRGMSASFK